MITGKPQTRAELIIRLASELLQKNGELLSKVTSRNSEPLITAKDSVIIGCKKDYRIGDLVVLNREKIFLSQRIIARRKKKYYTVRADLSSCSETIVYPHVIAGYIKCVIKLDGRKVDLTVGLRSTAAVLIGILSRIFNSIKGKRLLGRLLKKKVKMLIKGLLIISNFRY